MAGYANDRQEPAVKQGQCLPTVLIASTVQILWPIASSRTTAIAAFGPLGVVEICVRDLAQSPASGEQGVDRRARDGICSICRAARMDVSIDARKPSIVAILHGESDRVLWSDGARELLAARAGPNRQARAPPQSS